MLPSNHAWKPTIQQPYIVESVKSQFRFSFIVIVGHTWNILYTNLLAEYWTPLFYILYILLLLQLWRHWLVIVCIKCGIKNQHGYDFADTALLARSCRFWQQSRQSTPTSAQTYWRRGQGQPTGSCGHGQKVSIDLFRHRLGKVL